ncbi:MAG: metallophosphoesterase [Nitrososphaeria archaeon]|nr:metallophosphoesterase [Nitrososphaeria archaeon]MDW7986648.1 metallophosphoesterase [Nitrososphaerota archaeon]
MYEAEIKRLIESVEPLLEEAPQLILHNIGEFLIVGDTHGDLETTLRALKYAEKEGLKLVFLGDYVDRGPKQVENIVTLLESKLSWGENLTLLRGNHETVEMNRWYGFMDLVYSRFSVNLYDSFAELFSKLPYASLLYKSILTLHGGLAEGLEKVEDINIIPKGELDPRNVIALQIIWNDPSEDIEWFAPSWRGGGAKLYGWRAFNQFMEKNNLKFLIRAHEPQHEGYGELFNGRLKTVFSCRFYGIEPKAIRLVDTDVKEIVSLE